jgi:hypothetical protein
MKNGLGRDVNETVYAYNSSLTAHILFRKIEQFTLGVSYE